ncbi:MAG TPA: hypothetical protein VFP72_22320 [Kineosporiaceae bacterium]|nr:hypothetical protein [Kineosporiaceae bacterium]
MLLTTGSSLDITAAIAAIDDTAWTAVCYPQAFMDTQTGDLISDSEVPYTAFASQPAKLQAHGRPIVRLVRAAS